MYVIDGHNLIPKIPGWSLRDIDDEEKLIEALQRFARLRRKRVEVFFDGAPPGEVGERTYGQVRAHFVALGRTADEAIQQYLDQMGRSARTVTVVSSDHRVQSDARALHAAVQTSDAFASLLIKILNAPEAPAGAAPSQASGSLSGAELEAWYRVFQLDAGQAETPIEPPREEKKLRQQPRRSSGARRARHGFTPKKK